jgi:ribosome-binding protein aMBF1 (putative translation factor)
MVNVIKLDGREYVILPKADYLKLAGKDLEGAVDAVEYARKAIGEDLRSAREHAGLSQAELAEKLGKTQPMVSGAESGSIRVGERYVATVLKACGLPKSWKARRAKRGSRG